MAEGANRQRSGLQGYVTHQSFKGMRMPATVQNLVMRDYITVSGLVDPKTLEDGRMAQVSSAIVP